MTDDFSADRHRLHVTTKAELARLRTVNCRYGIEAAARALCADDYKAMSEASRRLYVEANWRTYVPRAESAIKAYMDAAR